MASVAKDAYDVNDIISALPKDTLSIDEEGLSVSGVDEAVNFVRENKPWLFQKENKSGMSSARPTSETGKKGYEDLDTNEKDALFRKALEGLMET